VDKGLIDPEPLAEWELQLLAEEERWRRGDDDDPPAGVREPRRKPPAPGSASVAQELPIDSDTDHV
jgi:hypothetical protein